MLPPRHCSQGSPNLPRRTFAARVDGHWAPTSCTPHGPWQSVCRVDRQLALFHGLYTLHPGRSALLLRGPLVLLGRDCFGSRERGRGGRPRPSCQTRQLGLDTGSIRSILCGRVRPTDFMLQWLSRPPIRLIPVVRAQEHRGRGSSICIHTESSGLIGVAVLRRLP